MCGVFILNSSTRVEKSHDYVLDAIRHRGPDGCGYEKLDFGRTHLGHVRLAILDTSLNGEQPMSDFSDRYVITYNGEVYNFLDLKEYLWSKFEFNSWVSGTDTEVIITGFHFEGIEFLKKLNGIFVLGIFDKFLNELYVLRDKLGIKPMYITKQDNTVYFCSEVKGLLALEGSKFSIRKQSLLDQLAFMYVPEPFTMFNEIEKLSPGVLYKCSDGKINSEMNLWEKRLEFKNEAVSEGDTINNFNSLLSEAVKRQMISDVPIGVFLSGGLDSSTITYLASSINTHIKKAYTIAFTDQDNSLDPQSSDLHYANIIAKELNIDLSIIQAEQDFLNNLHTYVDFMEDGICDPSAINTYLIAKKAKEDGIKVMLSGQGADEFMFGYRRHLAEYRMSKLSGRQLFLLSKLKYFVPHSLFGKFRAEFRRVKKISKLASLKSIDRIASYYSWAEPALLQDLFVDKTLQNPLDALRQYFLNVEDHNHMKRMLKVDQRFDLTALNLAYSDKMSMATGVELRVPFLDFLLVDFLNTLSPEQHIKKGKSKFLLKQAMQGKLPEEIINRSKAGFGLPIRSWLVSRESALINDYLSEGNLKRYGLYNIRAITNLVSDFRKNKEDHAYVLFALIIQQIWLSKYTLKYEIK